MKGWMLRILSFLLVLGCVVPLEHELVSQTETLATSTLDVGSTEACEVPTTNFCGIDYEVPAPIASLAESIESEIRSTVDSDDSEACRSVFKEALCRKRFPRCSTSTNQIFFEPLDNCVEELSNNCAEQASSYIQSGLCNSTQSALLSGSCRRLSEHDQSRNFLRHCNQLERDILVTDWMYEHIKQVDFQLQQAVFLRSQKTCWQEYRNFQCSAIGECTGNRVHLINTQGICERVINCFSDDVISILSEVFACHLLPSQQQVHTTETTPSTTRSTSAVQQTTKPTPVRVTPPTRTFIVNSSIRNTFGSLIFIPVMLCFS